jgi:hypothetical protein
MCSSNQTPFENSTIPLNRKTGSFRQLCHAKELLPDRLDCKTANHHDNKKILIDCCLDGAPSTKRT